MPVLRVAPLPVGSSNVVDLKSKALVYWRPTLYNMSDILDSSLIPNFPVNALKWVILSASMLVMSVKLRNINLEEEDNELSQLAQTQMMIIKGNLDAEQTRLNREEGAPMGDLSIDQIEDPSRGKPTQR
jgi:hypothetical protein